MIKRRGLIGLLFAAVLSTAFALSGAPPAAAAGPPFEIRNSNSAMCIQPPPGNLTIGAQLVQEPCNGSLEQQWNTISLGSDRYRLVNQYTLGCMDAHGPYTDGTPVDTWPCAGISNQVWSSSLSLPTSSLFTLKAGGKCLDVSGGSHSAGAVLQIWTCNHTPAQAFYTPR
ncbi:RICIN domain-containing protein [Actinoplanes sp. NPDC049599]|jgi:hypothetical protein|uniref:RICIN domain-containing protein n=1 Tax=Actinoplanes sp. NPDC049599 TaxID=3363903 RepID=UPI00378F30D9